MLQTNRLEEGWTSGYNKTVGIAKRIYGLLVMYFRQEDSFSFKWGSFGRPKKIVEIFAGEKRSPASNIM